jgi:hypothetical protein
LIVLVKPGLIGIVIGIILGCRVGAVIVDEGIHMIKTRQTRLMKISPILGIKLHKPNLKIVDKRQKMAKIHLILKHNGCIKIINGLTPRNNYGLVKKERVPFLTYFQSFPALLAQGG